MEGNKEFGSLKRLDLGECSSLIKTPDFTEILNLEFLDLSCCASLSRVHQSIGFLKRLKVLNLSDCASLKSHPDFTGISNLQYLNLSYCYSLSQVDPSILVLKRLIVWDITGCRSLKSFPIDMTGLESLEDFTLSECTKLEKFPEIVGMTSLQTLRLDYTPLKESTPLSSLSGLKHLSLKGCSGLEEFPDLSGLEFLSSFDGNNTAITKFPSVSLLPKKFFETIEVSGRNDLPAKSGESFFEGCRLLEEISHTFRVSYLWFKSRHPEYCVPTIGNIFNDSKVIGCKRNFLEGLCINYDSEHGGDILYFGLSKHLTGLRFVKINLTQGRDIFEFLMTGASLATNGIPEWFNNTTTTCSTVTVQDRLRSAESLSTRQLEVVDIVDFTLSMDNRKLKGCSLFFVFEFHGHAWDRLNFKNREVPLVAFACIFERDGGIPTEPLFMWAPEVPHVGPIEFWAFVPARWFLEHPNNWDRCSSCRASVVPLMKFKHGIRCYYFPTKETSDVSLEELEDPRVDVKDCRARLVYEDEASQFYSTVAPHGLHSKHFEQYSYDGSGYCCPICP